MGKARLLAKSNILDKADARLLGIDVGTPVAVHPEWMAVTENDPGPFTVTDIQFKGFYQLVTVQHEAITLNVRIDPAASIRNNARVDININRFHPLHNP